MDKLLTVTDLHVRAPGPEAKAIPILQGVSFSVGPGEILGILGESGAGKSTILRAVAGLLPERFNIRGSVLLRKSELLGMSEAALREVRGREMAMIFQEPLRHLNPSKRVRRTLDFLIRFHRGERRRVEVVRQRRQLLTEVGLPAVPRVERSYPHELSGGMRQRVMIAMALAGNPCLLLADEPTTALDYPLQKEIVALLRRLAKDRDMGVVYVSHDLRALGAVADELLVLLDGRIVERGETRKLLGEPKSGYTRQLINSAPGLASRGDSLVERGASRG